MRRVSSGYPAGTSGAPSGLDLQAETVRKEADLRKTKCAGVEFPGFRRKADPGGFKLTSPPYTGSES